MIGCLAINFYGIRICSRGISTMKNLCVWFVLGLISCNCLGRAGDLDTTFGGSGTGYILTSIDSQAVTGRALRRLSNGKIITVGNYYDASTQKYSLLLARYSSGGVLDTSFGGSGTVKTTLSNSTVAKGLALQSTGKIIVAADYDVSSSTNGITLLRYTPSGVLDTTFGSGNGYIKTFIYPMSEVNSVVVGPSNKITIAGWYYDTSKELVAMLLVRYTANGALDTSFGNGGYVKRTIAGYPSLFSAMVYNPSYLLATGSAENSKNNEDCVVLKMSLAGALTASFGVSKGYTRTAVSTTQRDIGLWLVLQGTKIVVAGEYFNTSSNHYKPFLLRYNANGTLDKTFGTAHNGMVKTSFSSGDDFVSTVLISGSTIIIVGSCVVNWLSKAVLARYKTTGSLDTSFGSNGVVKMPLSESWSNGAFITSGKLVMIGGSNYGTGVNRQLLARFKLS